MFSIFLLIMYMIYIFCLCKIHSVSIHDLKNRILNLELVNVDLELEIKKLENKIDFDKVEI